jgi:hypothetical protein
LPTCAHAYRPECERRRRVQAMLRQIGDLSGFAAGTGNSVPYYVPSEIFLAMIDVH